VGAIYMTRPAPPEPLAPAPSPAPVHVRRLSRVARPRVARLYGDTRPWRRSRLSVDVAGRVVWRSPSLELGADVAEGEPLLRLDPKPFALARDQARAEYALARAQAEAAEAVWSGSRRALERAREQEELARRERDRQQSLFDSGSTAASLRDQARGAWVAARSARERAEQRLAADRASATAAESRVQSALAALRRAEDALARSEVHAPFAGRISMPSAEVGDWLLPGSPVCTLLDLSQLIVRAPLPNSESAFLGPEPELRLHMPAFPEVEVGKLRLLGLSGEADPQSRARELRVAFENPQGRLPAGVFAVLEVDLGSRSAVWLRPEDYRLVEGVPTAFVVEGSGRATRAVTRPLRLGLSEVDSQGRSWIPVLEGLAPGELLAVDDLDMLGDGVPVAVLED